MELILSLSIFTFSAAYANVGCGVQAPNYPPWLPGAARHRIIRGQTATAHSWPWAIVQKKNGNVFCGGTLIRVSDNLEESDIVLTAAHCVGFGNTADSGYRGWTVGAGKHSVSRNEAGQQVRNVVQAETHSEYQAPGVRNDVAIVKLDRPIRFSDTIRPPCMPREGDPEPVGRQCVAAGWGRIDPDDKWKLPDTLQQLVPPVDQSSVCKNSWVGSFVEGMMLCVGALDGSSGVCNGDSGGMLVCKGDDDRWYQQGVLSYVGGNGRCLERNVPSVFTKVSAFADWINARINDMSSLVPRK